MEAERIAAIAALKAETERQLAQLSADAVLLHDEVVSPVQLRPRAAGARMSKPSDTQASLLLACDEQIGAVNRSADARISQLHSRFSVVVRVFFEPFVCDWA